MKFAKKKIPGSVFKGDIDTIVSRADAVWFIVEQLHGYRDPGQRSTISKKLGRAVLSGQLLESGIYQFRLGDLGLYLRQEWPGKFNDVPASPAAMSATTNIGKFNPVAALRPVTLPRSLEASHQEIHRLNDLLSAKCAEIVRLRQELDLLRPEALKFKERIVDKNRENARRKRLIL